MTHDEHPQSSQRIVAFDIGIWIDQSKNESVDTEIYIYLDAGVGGAIVNSGQLLHGQDGYARELGHIILGDEGFVELATLSGSYRK